MKKDIWKRDEFGVALKREVIREEFEGDWRERPLALNYTEGGTVMIASAPTGKGINVIHGMKCEIYLYPDGTYSANILYSWYRRIQRSASPGGKYRNGCSEYPTCKSCPFDDCEASELDL